jgi:hypothetical protein
MFDLDELARWDRALKQLERAPQPAPKGNE